MGETSYELVLIPPLGLTEAQENQLREICRDGMRPCGATRRLLSYQL